LAEEIGVGHTTVQRVWKEHGLKPHLIPPPDQSELMMYGNPVMDLTISGLRSR
jgi:hypothetical protein